MRIRKSSSACYLSSTTSKVVLTIILLSSVFAARCFSQEREQETQEIITFIRQEFEKAKNLQGQTEPQFKFTASDDSAFVLAIMEMAELELLSADDFRLACKFLESQVHTYSQKDEDDSTRDFYHFHRSLVLSSLAAIKHVFDAETNLDIAKGKVWSIDTREGWGYGKYVKTEPSSESNDPLNPRTDSTAFAVSAILDASVFWVGDEENVKRAISYLVKLHDKDGVFHWEIKDPTPPSHLHTSHTIMALRVCKKARSFGYKTIPDEIPSNIPLKLFHRPYFSSSELLNCFEVSRDWIDTGSSMNDMLNRNSLWSSWKHCLVTNSNEGSFFLYRPNFECSWKIRTACNILRLRDPIREVLCEDSGKIKISFNDDKFLERGNFFFAYWPTTLFDGRPPTTFVVPLGNELNKVQITIQSELAKQKAPIILKAQLLDANRIPVSLPIIIRRASQK